MNNTPTASVRTPQIKKRTRHGAISMLACPIPYIIKAPRICEIPFMEIHVAVRRGCSLRLYQLLVMMIKAGETVPAGSSSICT